MSRARSRGGTPLSRAARAAWSVIFAAWASPAAAQSVAERLALCAVCHGEDGNSRLANTPSLAGQPEFFLLNQLVLIREGVRPIAVMQEAVKGLKDEEIQVIAAHFARLPARASDEAIDPALAAKGAELAAGLQCASCHKADFTGQEQMPRLAKQRLDYLLQALQSYRDGTRSGADPLMVAAVQGRSDAELAALAHYAAALK